MVTTPGLVLDLTPVTFLAFASEPLGGEGGRDTAQAHRRRRVPLPHPSGRRRRQHRTRPKHVVGVLLRQRRISRPLGRHRPGIPVEHRCPRRLRARPAGNLDGASGFRGPRRADGRPVRGRVAPQRRRHHQLHPGPRSPTGSGHRSRPPGPPIRRAQRRNRVPTGPGRGLPRAQHPAAARSGTPPSTTTSARDPNHPGAAAIRRPIRSRARRRPRTVGVHRAQHPGPHHGGRRVRRDVQPREIRLGAVGDRPAGGGPRHRGGPRRRRRRRVGLHGSPRARSPAPAQPGWPKSTPPA